MKEISTEREWIFSLDIGTRNVVGVLGYEEEEKLHIAHTALIEHNTRAMLDGQIHDIGKVSQVIRQIKGELENKSKTQLKEVAIAAAGRVLKTKMAEAMIEFREEKRILASHIQALDMQGVESAKQMLYDEMKSSQDYYCVAYSPIKYFLDGYPIENLHGHKGKEIRSSIIATFLPRQVVDSLFASIEAAGLKVSHLTLEPISAINMSIPKEIRLLNLALVDIGAGTSDIAISKEGSITAYGMLPIAGDEFSEKLVEDYLVKFNTAELMKKGPLSSEEIDFIDILGIKRRLSSQEVLDKLEDTLDRLTSEIGDRIIELNGGKSPKAVFLVGGGSQFPKLTDKLAEKLEILPERVSVKDAGSISEEGMVYDLEIRGPEYITPIGICLTAWMDRRDSFITISINETKVKLLNTKSLTVMDAAIKANYPSNMFMLRNGRDLIFTVNNEVKKVKGGLGTEAQILLNGQRVDLQASIVHGDSINFIAGCDGKDAVITVKELLGDTFNGETQVYINGQLSSLDTTINNGDSVEVKSKEAPKEENFSVYVNEKVITLPKKDSYIFIDVLKFIDFNINDGKGKVVLKINGKPAKFLDPINFLDKIEIYKEEFLS